MLEVVKVNDRPYLMQWTLILPFLLIGWVHVFLVIDYVSENTKTKKNGNNENILGNERLQEIKVEIIFPRLDSVILKFWVGSFFLI